MSFQTKLITERDITKDYRWILAEPLIYDDGKIRVKVEKGFDFDYASIPALFRGILPKDGQKYDRAAVIHDALYSIQFDKKKADELFLKIMKEDGVPYAIRNIMYTAVKWFGYWAWKDSTQEDLNKYRSLICVTEY